MLIIGVNMKVCGLFLSFCLSVGVMAGKYSREINEQTTPDDGKNAVEFRVAKLNQVWEKANRVSDLCRETAWKLMGIVHSGVHL